jgi:hypothetical protein
MNLCQINLGKLVGTYDIKAFSYTGGGLLGLNWDQWLTCEGELYMLKIMQARVKSDLSLDDVMTTGSSFSEVTSAPITGARREIA